MRIINMNYNYDETEADRMKLLYVKASHFKNAKNDFEISLVAKSKKTAEDREYELLEIAEDLFVYNTLAFVGKKCIGQDYSS